MICTTCGGAVRPCQGVTGQKPHLHHTKRPAEPHFPTTVPALDPQPWVVRTGRFAGRYAVLSMIPHQFALIVFDPREGYEQDESRYLY